MGSYQPLVAGKEHGVEHGLVEEEVAHPLADDDVDLLGQLDVLQLLVDDLDGVLESVGLDDGLGGLGDASALNLETIMDQGNRAERKREKGCPCQQVVGQIRGRRTP